MKIILIALAMTFTGTAFAEGLNSCKRADYPSICVGKKVMKKLNRMGKKNQAFKLQGGTYDRFNANTDHVGDRIVNVGERDGKQIIYYHGSNDSLWATFECEEKSNVCTTDKNKSVLFITGSKEFGVSWEHEALPAVFRLQQ